ncbi:MAG: DegT/DnrJ/EryC1/StrS family aminotransferase [Rhodospirillaceae bacterium]
MADTRTPPNQPAVPWSGRGSRYSDDDIAFIVEAIQTADPLTQGRYQAEFEKAFRDYAGAEYAFAVSSCTAALHLAAVLCRLQPGDEVITPAHTFAASAIPFAQTGAKLVWADIDPATFVVSAASVERLITPNTKVIVVVHLYGLMADMDAIMALAEKHGLLVVEDAAQSLGATYKGRQAGTIGDFGCFSFHTHKNISTLGEGGMLTVRDAETAALVPGFRHNGMRPYQGERPQYWKPAMSNVDFDWDGVWPFNYCIGEVQCAAGTTQVPKIDDLNALRRRRAEKFMAAVKDFPELAFQATPEGRTNVYYCLPARYDGTPAGRGRDDFMTRMATVHNVQMVVQYYPLYRYPMFEKAGFGEADCPETDRFFDRMVSFPFHAWMPDDQFEYLIDATRETLTELRR